MGYQYEAQLREDYRPYVTRIEGVIDHFYLDNRGNVTVGIGHLLGDEHAAMGLHMIYNDRGVIATPEQLKHEYQVIK